MRSSIEVESGIGVLNTLVASHVGICIKDLTKKILFQNQACMNRCGDKAGATCRDQCMKSYHSHSDPIALQGVHIPPHVDMATKDFETVVVNDGRFITTIQCPITEKNSAIMEEILKYGLTKTELKIVEMRLGHLSNQEVATKLFISSATLRTHLNNAYKKMPAHLKELLIPKQ